MLEGLTLEDLEYRVGICTGSLKLAAIIAAKKKLASLVATVTLFA